MTDRFQSDEFTAIAEVLARLGARATGVGDDGAAIDVPRGDRMVVSVDASSEGHHFWREWLTPQEIGYRAAVAALSDLAAMAATPIGILIAFGVPQGWRAALADVADGMGDAAASVGATVLGGNISASSEFSITTTVIGRAYAPLGRSGAHAGDAVFVTGRFGGPGAAVRDWLCGGTPSAANRERFARPSARVAEGQWLAAHGATALIDVSDGLAQDAGHMARASGCKIAIAVDSIPRMDGVDALDAAASGEEYELLATGPATLDVAVFASRFGIPLTRVGSVNAGEASVDFTNGGRAVAAPAGYDHFSR